MTYATSNTSKRNGLRFETDNFKQSRYVGILYKQYFGGFICAMINLTNNKKINDLVPVLQAHVIVFTHDN